MDKVKIGVIGCGTISSIYFKNLSTLFLNTEVYACADIDINRAAAAAKEWNIPHLMTVNELLECEEVKIVVNLTIPKAHFEICKRALEAGKNVYVEKPLSLTLEQGIELNRIAEEKNLLLGSAPDTFLGASLQTCIKLINDGYIGKLIAATAFMLCHGHESWHPAPEFYYKAGGGPMFDMGPYYLTALISMLGPVKQVCGMTNITFPTRTITSPQKYGKQIDVEVPTHVAGMMRFDNDVLATIITSFDVWSSSLPHIEIYGTLGTIIVPDPNNYDGVIKVKTAAGNNFMDMPLTHIYSNNSRGIGVSDMARCILQGGENRANGKLANHVLELMHAFHVTSDSGKYYEMTTTCSRPEPLQLGLINGYV